MSNLAARLATAVVIVPLLITIINWHNPIGFWLFVTVAIVFGLHEWARMTLPERTRDRWFCIVVGTAMSAGCYWWSAVPLAFAALVAAALIAAFLFFLFSIGAIETVAARMSHTFTGWLYVGLLGLLPSLKRAPNGASWVYVSLTVAWLSDTGGYFAGRFLGPYWPRRLYERISPKKTVVGALGGMAGSLLATVVAKLWYFDALSWADCVAVAVPANVLGQLGDLAESLFKRSVGVKDSGALLPGHGGLLDRIDALLFVAPYVFLYAHWIFGLL